MNTNKILRGEYTDSKGFLHREYEDAQGNIYTEYRDDQGNLHTYQYAYDPALSSRLQNEREAKAQSNGVLVGALIVALGSLLAGSIYLLTRPTPPDPLQVINVESPEPEADLTPEAPAAESPSPTINVEPSSQPPAQQDINITTTAPNNPNPSNPSVVVVPPSPTAAPAPSPTPSASAPNPATSSPTSSTAPASSGNTVTDGALKTNISKAFKDKWPNNQLTVEVQNGVVTVSGKAANQAQLDQIETMVEAIAGVKGMMIKATAS